MSDQGFVTALQSAMLYNCKVYDRDPVILNYNLICLRMVNSDFCYMVEFQILWRLREKDGKNGKYLVIVRTKINKNFV